MHPLKQLRNILNTQNSNHGTLVAVQGNSFIIATNRGIVNSVKSNGDITNYRVGDRLTLMNGIITGKRSNTSKVYVL